jgi:hypothetical protein
VNTPEKITAKQAETVQLGAPLRDAAVDPHPSDFLPATNAGRPGPAGNPHGPHVVSPGIEAIGAAPAAAVEHTPGCAAHRVTAWQCDYGAGLVGVAYCPDCGRRTERPAGNDERN